MAFEIPGFVRVDQNVFMALGEIKGAHLRRALRQSAHEDAAGDRNLQWLMAEFTRAKGTDSDFVVDVLMHGQAHGSAWAARPSIAAAASIAAFVVLADERAEREAVVEGAR
jgi:hypothetical protein